METDRFCPRCGIRLPGALDNCPQCLLRLGLDLPPRDPDATAHVSAPPSAGAAAPPPHAASQPPSIEEIVPLFPQLELLDVVGQGGMGVVYRARQRKLDRVVALKILSFGADQPAFAERFLREARAMARLAHPSIVAVHDFGETSGRCWLLMEYVEGVNLRQALQSGQLTPESALKIVPQICDALQAAHDLGVVHRDIKPENVLLDKRGGVKIADFGLAKLVGQAPEDRTLTRSAQIMGTPHYMAPEQMQASHDVDHRADIFSLGVVFYEMLTGRLPIGHFDLPSKKVSVDVRVDEIVLRALEHEPERRYQHAVDVKTAVQTMSAGAPGSSPRATPRPRLRDLMRGRRVWLLGGGIAFAFLAAWPITQELWQQRELGLAALGVGLIAISYALLRTMLALAPDLEARLAAAPSWMTIGRRALALPIAAVGIASLGAAIVCSWDEGTEGYQLERVAYQQLPRFGNLGWAASIEPELKKLPSWGEKPVPALTGSRTELFDVPGKLIDIDPVPNAVLGVVLLLLAPFALVVTTRWWWSFRRCWRPVLASALVVPVWIGCCVVGAELNRGDRPLVGPSLSESVVVNAPMDQVHERLRDALWRYRYRTETDIVRLFFSATTAVDGVTGNAVVRQSRLLAEPESPFERWRLRWDGPYRLLPQLVFELTALPGDGECVLTWHAGILPVRDGRRTQWSEQLSEMLADLKG
ncbi:MAG: serine/threonine-protein kinase [Planctomycetota bacterium]